MSRSQLPKEAATTQDEANELALLESFDAGQWASAPNEAQDIARYRSAAKRSVAERLLELRHKHGTELENGWITRFAHPFDALTQSEARYFARTETADIIRNRIADSQQAGIG